MTPVPDWVQLALAFGALLHLAIGICYGIWRRPPWVWFGIWLVFAWAGGLLRAVEVRRNPFDLSDFWAIVVWGQVTLAALCVLVSMVRRITRSRFTKRDETLDDREPVAP